MKFESLKFEYFKNKKNFWSEMKFFSVSKVLHFRLKNKIAKYIRHNLQTFLKIAVLSLPYITYFWGLKLLLSDMKNHTLPTTLLYFVLPQFSEKIIFIPAHYIYVYWWTMTVTNANYERVNIYKRRKQFVTLDCLVIICSNILQPLTT